MIIPYMLGRLLSAMSFDSGRPVCGPLYWKSVRSCAEDGSLILRKAFLKSDTYRRRLSSCCQCIGFGTIS